MYNDSLETLLLRHYGSTGPTPPHLEQQLLSSVRQEAISQRQQQQVAAQLREYRVSRRRAVKLVAIGSASLGLLSAGIESLQLLETNVFGSENAQPALS